MTAAASCFEEYFPVYCCCTLHCLIHIVWSGLISVMELHHNLLLRKCAASIEVTLLQNRNLDKQTLFSFISFLFGLKSRIRRLNPFFLDVFLWWREGDIFRACVYCMRAACVCVFGSIWVTPKLCGGGGGGGGGDAKQHSPLVSNLRWLSPRNIWYLFQLCSLLLPLLWFRQRPLSQE